MPSAKRIVGRWSGTKLLWCLVSTDSTSIDQCRTKAIETCGGNDTADAVRIVSAMIARQEIPSTTIQLLIGKKSFSPSSSLSIKWGTKFMSQMTSFMAGS